MVILVVAAKTITGYANEMLNSPFRGPMLAGVTLLLLWVFGRIVLSGLWIFLEKKVDRPEDASLFLKLWRYLWLVLTFILTLVALSGSFQFIGISAGVMGMVLGWILKDPVLSVAAWLIIVVKRPFRVGDRVAIGSSTGNVAELSLTHIVLQQPGPGGRDDNTGARILVPNIYLFSKEVQNFNYEKSKMIAEASISVTQDSDIAGAERILKKAATTATESSVESADLNHRLSLNWETGV